LCVPSAGCDAPSVRAALVVLAAVSVVGLAGCGGQTEAQDRTPSVDPSGEFRAYLDVMRVEDAKFRAVAAEVTKAEARTYWRNRGRLYRRAAKRFDDLAVRMKVIDAPAPLRGAHADLGKSLQLLSQMLEQVRAVYTTYWDFDEAQAAFTREISPLSARYNELRSNWRIEVSAYARKLNTNAPAWVGRVGVPGK
jgi:hypothetical protein